MKPPRASAMIVVLGLSAGPVCGGAVAQGSPATASAPLNPLAMQSLDGLSATREKPLFAPTRRPPGPPPPPPPPVAHAPPPPPPPAPPPALTFFGVVTEGDGARALVRGPANEGLRLRIGDRVGDWKVQEVDRRRLVLSLGDRSETFSLFDRTREKQARVPGPSTRPRHQTAPNTGYLYEGRVAPARPTQPAKDEPEL